MALKFRGPLVMRCAVILAILTATISAQDGAPLVPVRINVAEGIIEPFWDPEISGFSDWTVDKHGAQGLKVWQNWAAVDYEWVQADDEVALRMTRKFQVDVREYDRLLVKMAAPEGAVLRVAFDSDAGANSTEIEIAQSTPHEYAVDLQGAAELHSLSIELEKAGEGPKSGWIEWIGVQNKQLLDAYFRRWDYSGLDWSRHIQPDDAPLAFAPVYGIFRTAEELDQLREEHAKALAETGESRFTRMAANAAAMNFEAGIHEFANSGGSDGGRTRDVDQPPLPGNERLAEAGLVLRDRSLLVAAARYALSLAASQYWDRDFRSHFPGGPADDRAFRRSYTSEDIAVVLDLAGEVLTPAGKHYLLRRLAEEGVGPTTYVTWKHEYIHHTNQLAYFNQGRMAALLVLERSYPRVQPYTDLALNDTIENLTNSILPDGGYAEGPTYFGAFARRNYQTLKMYARGRRIDVSTIVPDALRRTSDFAEAISSTTSDDVIPIGDSGRMMGYETLEAMVELMPNSFWQTMLAKRRAIDGETNETRFTPKPRPFVALPNLGLLASCREVEGLPLKVLVYGNSAGADHAHEDKGSFVLEYGGEVFAMDPGSASYSDPIHQQYKHAQRHNMLVPVGTAERPAPPIKLPVDVLPIGTGEIERFEALIDASPGWERYYERWTRHWISTTPTELVIEDTYALKRGTGVEFYWQTELPCTIDGQRISIRGDKASVVLTVPENCPVRIDTLPMAGDGIQNRIAVARSGREGTLRVSVQFHRD